MESIIKAILENGVAIKEFGSFIIIIIIVIASIKLLYTYIISLIEAKKISKIREEIEKIFEKHFKTLMEKYENDIKKNENNLGKLNSEIIKLQYLQNTFKDKEFKKLFQDSFDNKEIRALITDIIKTQLDIINNNILKELQQISQDLKNADSKFYEKTLENTNKLDSILLILNNINDQIKYLLQNIPTSKIKEL